MVAYVSFCASYDNIIPYYFWYAVGMKKHNQVGAVDIILLAALSIVLVVGGFVVYRITRSDEVASNDIAQPTSEITSFDECVAAGNPVMESYPEQCRTKDGQLFVNDEQTETIEATNENPEASSNGGSEPSQGGSSSSNDNDSSEDETDAKVYTFSNINTDRGIKGENLGNAAVYVVSRFNASYPDEGSCAYQTSTDQGQDLSMVVPVTNIFNSGGECAYEILLSDIDNLIGAAGTGEKTVVMSWPYSYTDGSGTVRKSITSSHKITITCSMAASTSVTSCTYTSSLGGGGSWTSN